MSIIKRARALLADASPGPWGLGANRVICRVDGWADIAKAYRKADADLIVAAPELLAALCDDLETLHAERDVAVLWARRLFIGLAMARGGLFDMCDTLAENEAARMEMVAKTALPLPHPPGWLIGNAESDLDEANIFWESANVGDDVDV